MEPVFTGNFLKVYRKTHRYPSGYEGPIEYIKHPGAILAVPFLDNGDVVMIRQYRPTLDAYVWEFPAGTLEAGEDPRACVDRELEEEIGYRPRVVEHLASISLCPGYSTEIIHCYKATGLDFVGRNALDDENITVVTKTFAEVTEMVRRREITDAKSLAALAYLLCDTKKNQ
jgi:ADP-ribose pyrophosphatase